MSVMTIRKVQNNVVHFLCYRFKIVSSFGSIYQKRDLLWMMKECSPVKSFFQLYRGVLCFQRVVFCQPQSSRTPVASFKYPPPDPHLCRLSAFLKYFALCVNRSAAKQKWLTFREPIKQQIWRCLHLKHACSEPLTRQVIDEKTCCISNT